MKRTCIVSSVVFSLLLVGLSRIANAVEPDLKSAAAQLLDSTLKIDRDLVIENQSGAAGPLILALAEGIPAGDVKEEYRRIPWIWRVAMAAGKRDDAKELKELLGDVLPKNDEPLRDWQAVVVGGGLINGLSMQGLWPGDRITEIIGADSDLKARWQRTLELAAVMTEDGNVKNGTRYDALRIVGVIPGDKPLAQLAKYLVKESNGELQQGAVSGLTDVKSKNVAGLLVKNFGNLTEKNRGFALDALLRDETRVGALLNAVEQKQIDGALLGPERLGKLLTTANDKQRVHAEKLFGKITTDTGAFYVVGVAKLDVTPDYPIRLNGYLARKSESEGVIQHLFVKALAIGSDKDGPAVLVSTDNCIVPKHVRDEVATRLAKKGIASEKFSICTSHTHSAPKLAGAADNIFGMDATPTEQAHIDRYTKEFTDAVEKVALAALADRKPAKLSWGQSSAEFGMNRRTKGGPSDHDVPVLKVTDKNGKVRALLVNYACHCTTLSDKPNQICADWAGYAQEYLERDHPGAIAMTIMGCGADQNPAPRPGVHFAQQHGQSLTTAVNELLSNDLTQLHGKLECRSKMISLPFDKQPTREDYVKQAGDTNPSNYAVVYFAKKQIARLDRGEKLETELPYLVQTWNFGDELAMVFLPGEVVVDYSLRFKKEFDSSRLWVNAYANWVPCYIPSKRIWKEGGYEGGGAMIYYDHPTRLSENTEELIAGAVRELMPKNFAATDMSGIPAPKSPSEALKAVRVKPGFAVDLAANEPTIVDPVAVDFGTDGKLWVVEMNDYPTGKHGNYEPGGRVKLLTSSKNDGHYDKGTIFVEDIPFPTGIMQWRKGVLICTAPDILYAEDTNGDGKADIVKKLYTGFFTNNFQARVNCLRWGLDNWVYAAAGLFPGKIHSEINGKDYELSGRDFRFNPDTGDFEPVSGLSQQGRERDDFGNWFGCDNSTLAWSFPMEERYVRRNPFVPAPEPRVHTPNYPDPNVLYPASKTAERFNHPESANRTTSGCGLSIYRDEFLGKEYYGNSFTCEPVHNMVRRLVLDGDGIVMHGHKAADEQTVEFFASTDNWSRPVETRTGPDGALWISDMYRYVIEHPRWIPAETLARLNVRWGDDKGRIYRVYPAGKKLKPLQDLTKLSSSKLVAMMDSSNGTLRDLIHREIYQRADVSAIKPLQDLASKSLNPAVRVQALCALDGLKGLTPDVLEKAITDKDNNVRRHAVRLCESFLRSSSASESLQSSLLKLGSDADLGIRFQLALTLGEWNDPRAGKVLGDLARENIFDSWMRAAVLSSAVHQPGEILKGVLASSADTPNRGELAGLLIATAAGSDDPKVFESILITMAPAKGKNVEQWQLVALANLQEALGRKKMTLSTFGESANASVRDAVRDIETVIIQAGAIAKNSKAHAAEREAAVRLLSGSKSDEDVQTLVTLATQTSSSHLRTTALASLRAQKNPKVPELLLAGWTQYSPSVREGALDILLGREEGIDRLFDALEKKMIAPTEIPIANRQQLQKSSNPKIQQRAATLLPSQSSNRAEVLKKFAVASELKGNPEHGAELFSQLCSSCHRLKGVGNSVGPDLAALNDKPVDYFLLQILDPNAVIEPRFVQYNIELKDERSLSGVIKSETGTSLTLVQAGGVTENILRSDITSMRASALSLMPDGLEEGKTPQDFADLISYVKSQPSQFGSASPEKAAAAQKSFVAEGVNGLAKVVSASEKTDYASWLGSLPLAHCRQTDGSSKVVWESEPLKEVKPRSVYTFRLPVGMGFLSSPAGKFYLKVNGKSAVAFDVSTGDAVWEHPAHEVVMRYQVMENNAEDSNGVLTISVNSIWLEAGKPVVFEVTGSAANSQRWFGVYQVPQLHAAK